MASPIRWFRKHSQFFIVVFGVVLMAIFGLGSVFSSLNPSSFATTGQSEDPVVAQWRGGELKNSDLFRLRQLHFATQRFLRNVYKYAIDQNDGQAFRIAAEELRPLGFGESNPTETSYNSEVMNRYFLAQRAKEEGFVVDDEMVYQYIAQFGGETPMSRDMLKQLNREVNNNVPLTAIVRHLQLELLWQQMEHMTDAGFAFDTGVGRNAISPTEAVELYERANRKIECRVLPISVEEYVSKVGTPSDSDLKELYEKGKYEYPRYGMDEPGFKQLKKANIQYFVADLDTFLKNEMAKLTDEEVEAEYKRLVEAGDNLVMQIVPKSTENAEESTEETTQENSDKDKEPETTTEDPNEDPAPAPGDESSESDETGGTVDNLESDGNEENGDSSNGGYTSLRFQDETQQDEKPENSDETADDEKDESSSDEEANSTENVEEVTSDDGKQEPSESGDNKTTGNEETQDNEGISTGDPEMDDSDDPSIQDEPVREAKPLEDVAEDIKRRMKSQDARTAMNKAIDEVEKELRKYNMKYNKWEFEKEREKDEEIEQPELPDYSAMADKYGLQYFETGLINRTEVEDQKIADAARFDRASRRIVQITDDIFDQFEITSVYQPAKLAQGSTSYVYWLSEKVDHKVPTFEEAKESITEYWQRNQAIELAMKRADEIVKDLNDNNKLLSAEFPEKSKDTGEFSWFTTFGRFAYGNVEGVAEPGDDFMSVAYGLKLNEAKPAINEPRDTVYVVQAIAESKSSLAELGTDYLEKNFFMIKRIPQEVLTAKALYRQKTNIEWLKEFNEIMDVKVIGQ